MTRYDLLRDAFEYLEGLAPLEDQGPLDAGRLDLMQNPTKTEAANLYEAGIRLWLDAHAEAFQDDLKVQAMVETYGAL